MIRKLYYKRFAQSAEKCPLSDFIPELGELLGVIFVSFLILERIWGALGAHFLITKAAGATKGATRAKPEI